MTANVSVPAEAHRRASLLLMARGPWRPHQAVCTLPAKENTLTFDAWVYVSSPVTSHLAEFHQFCTAAVAVILEASDSWLENRLYEQSWKVSEPARQLPESAPSEALCPHHRTSVV